MEPTEKTEASGTCYPLLRDQVVDFAYEKIPANFDVSPDPTS